MRENKEGLTQKEEQERLFQEWRHNLTDNRYRAAETAIGLWWIFFWTDEISPLYLNRAVILFLALLLLRSYNSSNNSYRQPIARFNAAERFRNFALQDNLPKVQQCITVFGSRDLDVIHFDTGMGPLHCAVKGLALQPAKLLKNSGADVNLQDNKGNTPVHTAIMNILTIERNRTITERATTHTDVVTELSKRTIPNYKFLLGLMAENPTGAEELEADEKSLVEWGRSEVLKLDKDKTIGYDLLTGLVKNGILNHPRLIEVAKRIILLQLANDKQVAYDILLELLAQRKDPKIQAGLERLKANPMAQGNGDGAAASVIPEALLALARQVQELDLNIKIDPTLKNSEQKTILDLLERVSDRTCPEYKTAYSKVRTLAERAHQPPMPSSQTP